MDDPLSSERTLALLRLMMNDNTTPAGEADPEFVKRIYEADDIGEPLKIPLWSERASEELEQRS